MARWPLPEGLRSGGLEHRGRSHAATTMARWPLQRGCAVGKWNNGIITRRQVLLASPGGLL
eukprot:13023010-Alexandrium_andersonii.AAC.1